MQSDYLSITWGKEWATASTRPYILTKHSLEILLWRSWIIFRFNCIDASADFTSKAPTLCTGGVSGRPFFLFLHWATIFCNAANVFSVKLSALLGCYYDLISDLCGRWKKWRVNSYMSTHRQKQMIIISSLSLGADSVVSQNTWNS